MSCPQGAPALLCGLLALALGRCDAGADPPSITILIPEACDSPSDTRLPPIAVGSRVHVRFHGGYLQEPYCPEPLFVEVDSLSFVPSTLLSFEASGSTLQAEGWLTAHGPGTTVVSIVGQVSGVKATGEEIVETRLPARARYRMRPWGAPRRYLQPECAPGQPLLAQPGSTLLGISQELLDAQGATLAGEDLLPTLPEGQVERDAVESLYEWQLPLVVTLPNREGALELAPPAGTEGLTLVITSDATVTGLGGLVEAWDGSRDAEVVLWTEIAGAADCQWLGVPVLGSVVTPETCYFHGIATASVVLDSYETLIRVGAMPGSEGSTCTLQFQTQLPAPATNYSKELSFLL